MESSGPSGDTRWADELATPDFVWDMSNFHGWPEQQVYEGVEVAEALEAVGLAE
jgi:hypothetical protein